MIRHSELLARASRLHVPLSVTVELTSRCNYRCGHCYLDGSRHADALGTERVVQLLDELVEAGTLYLTLTGGEPLVREDWPVIVRRARELGFDLRLFTNASLVDDSAAELLAASTVAVEVSFHSMRREVFDRATGMVGSFDRSLRGVELLRRHRVAVKLKLPVTTGTVDGASELAGFAARVGAEFFSDPRMVVARDGDIAPIHQRVAPRDLHGYYRLQATHYRSPEECGPPPDGDSPLCAAGVRTCTVTASGELKACNQMPGTAGSILHAPFVELWRNAPLFNRLRGLRRSDLTVCDGCTRIAYCARCPAQALAEDGDLLGPARWSCEHAAALEQAFAVVRGA